MLSEICAYLNNYFEGETPVRFYGTFTIDGGTFTDPDLGILQAGQYFRIIDSVFNDGIHQYPDSELYDETFTGAVWVLKIPPEVIAISDEIDAWKANYLKADGPALSPYTSESFGGYSYSKGSAGDGVSTGGDWTKIGGFTARLERWRKPRCRY